MYFKNHILEFFKNLASNFQPILKERKQVHFTSYRSERGPGEQTNTVTGQKMIPLATGLIERETGRKFWLTTQGTGHVIQRNYALANFD